MTTIVLLREHEYIRKEFIYRRIHIITYKRPASIYPFVIFYMVNFNCRAF